MKKYDVVIIGSGLGGLECGYILSKKGYNVCILEKNSQIGGCLQTFKRRETFFDTGFHFVGGLDEGQPLRKLFGYFDLLNLPWHRMDENGFAEVILDDKSYFLASGYERFVDTLVKDFPHQKKQLQDYIKVLKKTGENIGKSFLIKDHEENPSLPLFEKSAYKFLGETIDDPLLRNVISGSSLTMDLSADKLPLYVFAQINNSFIQSAWRLKGGGSLIADKLADSITQMGGTIRKNAKVTHMVEKNGEINVVEINNEEQIQAQHVISNIHPAATLALIPESQHIRNLYRKRITNLSNTFGVFTVHLKLKENTVQYRNRNIFIYKNQQVWNVGSNLENGLLKALVSYQVPENNTGFTSNIDILFPINWQDVAKWKNTSVGRRGEEYIQFKQQKAEEYIDWVSNYIPNLKENIESYYTSTPLTYRDYTATWQGSSYGIQKDYNSILLTLLTPQTPIPNLLLTGQNLNLHGILGVTMTSFFTCARLVGMENLVKDLDNF